MILKHFSDNTPAPAEPSTSDYLVENVVCKGCNQSYARTSILIHIKHRSRASCKLKYTDGEILELEEQSRKRNLQLRKKYSQEHYSPEKRASYHQEHYSSEERAALHQKQYSPEENAAHYSPEKRAALHEKNYSPEKRAVSHQEHYSPEKRAQEYEERQTFNAKLMTIDYIRIQKFENEIKFV